ncbi:Calmodulin binding protein-like protein [Cynara cardunculus var. scolymus]|uniref:Calmodulin binding protein-like protein n=1 Tax=Cynara cardunculus var. scolymus TaxID=59895 RepID=A0A103XXS8_CYNCS|nr:Calmodulin binding protein-like protein [Cynara cardunculus var. scolymus]
MADYDWSSLYENSINSRNVMKLHLGDQMWSADNEASASSKPVHLKLIFPDEITSPVYTRTRITGKAAGSDGGRIESIRVILVDGQTNQQVTTGPAASATVNLVLLPANFGDSTTRHGGVWTPQDFQDKIITNWGKKKNLLLGDLTVVLKDGIGTVGAIRIKHDGKPLKKDKFRIGAMVVDCPLEVQEGITVPFEVKDRRNESKDSRQLLATDKLWRLKNIGKKGRTIKCLENEGVLTVSDFLDMHDSNPRALKEVTEVLIFPPETPDGYGSVGSTSQLSNNYMPFSDSDCYIPQMSENDISVRDYEEDGLVILAGDFVFEPFPEDGTNGAATRVSNGREGRVVLAKKRWKKVRATLWFSLVSCFKAGFGTVGSTPAAGYAGSKVGPTLAD